MEVVQCTALHHPITQYQLLECQLLGCDSNLKRDESFTIVRAACLHSDNARFVSFPGLH